MYLFSECNQKHVVGGGGRGRLGPLFDHLCRHPDQTRHLQGETAARKHTVGLSQRAFNIHLIHTHTPTDAAGSRRDTRATSKQVVRRLSIFSKHVLPSRHTHLGSQRQVPTHPPYVNRNMDCQQLVKTDRNIFAS